MLKINPFNEIVKLQTNKEDTIKIIVSFLDSSKELKEQLYENVEGMYNYIFNDKSVFNEDCIKLLNYLSEDNNFDFNNYVINNKELIFSFLNGFVMRANKKLFIDFILPFIKNNNLTQEFFNVIKNDLDIMVEVFDFFEESQLKNINIYSINKNNFLIERSIFSYLYGNNNFNLEKYYKLHEKYFDYNRHDRLVKINNLNEDLELKFKNIDNDNKLPNTYIYKDNYSLFEEVFNEKNREIYYLSPFINNLFNHYKKYIGATKIFEKKLHKDKLNQTLKILFDHNFNFNNLKEEEKKRLLRVIVAVDTKKTVEILKILKIKENIVIDVKNPGKTIIDYVIENGNLLNLKKIINYFNINEKDLLYQNKTPHIINYPDLLFSNLTKIKNKELKEKQELFNYLLNITNFNFKDENDNNLAKLFMDNYFKTQKNNNLLYLYFKIKDKNHIDIDKLYNSKHYINFLTILGNNNINFTEKNKNDLDFADYNLINSITYNNYEIFYYYINNNNKNNNDDNENLIKKYSYNLKEKFEENPEKINLIFTEILKNFMKKQYIDYDTNHIFSLISNNELDYIIVNDNFINYFFNNSSELEITHINNLFKNCKEDKTKIFNNLSILIEKQKLLNSMGKEPDKISKPIKI